MPLSLAFALSLQLGAAATAGPPAAREAKAWPRFLGGAASGLLAHEASHVFFDLATGAGVGIKRVDYAGIPFPAITHDPLGPRQEYLIAQAGFLAQHASNEWLLSRDLRKTRAPFHKGWLAMNLGTSAAYAWAAFTRTGPPERDTRAMAAAARVDEPVIGALVLAPAVLDAWRYARPEAKAPRWLSRACKAALVLLIVRAD